MPRNRNIDRIDKNTNEVLQTYETIKDAQLWVIQQGLTNSNVPQIACNGSKPTAYGFKWKFE